MTVEMEESNAPLGRRDDATCTHEDAIYDPCQPKEEYRD
jgi:hypothetical protein